MNAENETRFAQVNARLREIKAENDARFREMNAVNDARLREIKAEVVEVKAEVRAVHSRIDTQQRVVWPLLAMLATTIFSMLYRFLTDN